MENEPHGVDRRRAFTLIELLIVIALVALLAAILFPTYQATRRKAYQSQCVSNLRQIGQAFDMYRSDWDGAWPTGPAFSGDYDHGWWLPLQKYVKGKQDLLSCPVVVRSGATVQPTHIPGYALNGRLQQALYPLWEANVPFPATTVELCDAPEKYSHLNGYDSWEGNILRPDPIPDASWKRHSDGANYLLCDGHARWYAPGAVGGDDNFIQDGTRPAFALQWRY